ncbi:MAG TPA: retropepsin-like aspartic protease [Verrucomicrobiaceae bacterium]
MPFDYRDGLIWVKVKTDAGNVPLNFLLDSGAGTSVLNLPTAHKLGIKLEGKERVGRVGATADAWHVRDFHAHADGIPLSSSPLAVDLSETSHECSRTIDGLIGQDFFRNRVIRIDFKERCIRLLDRADTSCSCSIMSLKMTHDVMCVAISVDGSQPRWTRLDTGCDDGLHWVAGSEGGSGRVTLQLGDEKIFNVRTIWHRSPIFPSEAGLLGNGVLSNYRITVDGVGNRLLLERF